MKKITALIGPAIFGFVVGFLLLEAVFTVLFDVYECDDRLGWRYQPGSTALKVSRSGEFRHWVRLNSHGFRDSERSNENQAETFRVLLLGDSFLAGMQVRFEDSLPALLAGFVGPEDGSNSRIEILNLGTDGYGTAQQLLLLRELGGRYAPDLIIAQALVNDIADNSIDAGGANHYLATRCGRPYFSLQSGLPIAIDGGRPLRPTGVGFFGRLLRRSAIYSNFVPATQAPSPGGFEQWDIYNGPPGPAVQEAWSLTRAIFRTLRDEAQRVGSTFAVMLIPEVFQIDMPSPRTGERDPGFQDKLRPHLQWRELFEDLDIRFVDLRPPLQASADAGQRPYLEYDSHWNVLGHRIAAEFVASWMLENCAELGVPIGSCVR